MRTPSEPSQSQSMAQAPSEASAGTSFAPPSRRRLSLAHTVIVAVVCGCLAVPGFLVGVAAVLADRAAVETQVARGTQLAMSTATLFGVARDSGSSTDVAVLRAFMRAVVTDDVRYVVVSLPPLAADEPPFILAVEAETGLLDGDPYEAALPLLKTPPAGTVVIDAGIEERDRSSGKESRAAQVLVGMRRPGPPTRAVVGFLVAGVGTALGVALVLVSVLRRRLIRPLQLVTRGLKRVARGEQNVDVDDLRQPGVRPPREIESLIDGFDALVVATRERGQLRNRLQQGLGAQIADADDLLERPPSQANVSVLVVDVRDFTSLQASMTPELAVRFVDALFTALVAVVERHGGHVERFLGDGLVALWGAPRPSDDPAGAAVAAAIDMEAVVVQLMQEQKQLGVPRFQVGIGVASGMAAVGGVGPASRRSFAVLGEVPALARKIQQEAKSQGVPVLVAENTFLAVTSSPVSAPVARAVSWQRLPPLVLRGIGMPLTLYRPERVARKNDDVTRVTRG